MAASSSGLVSSRLVHDGSVRAVPSLKVLSMEAFAISQDVPKFNSNLVSKNTIASAMICLNRVKCRVMSDYMYAKYWEILTEFFECFDEDWISFINSEFFGNDNKNELIEMLKVPDKKRAMFKRSIGEYIYKATCDSFKPIL